MILTRSLRQQQGKQASMLAPVMTHFRFPMFVVPSEVRSSYSKLAIIPALEILLCYTACLCHMGSQI